ncbi:beta-1,3-galactosyltransferase 5-like, partial [Penaeus monodon]|uniref:beta-1,3-galactosyltransferase 5-like n=1 Tax=Penaeus monodon TaxID=6687 RepID=UPI0018A7A970
MNSTHRVGTTSLWLECWYQESEILMLWDLAKYFLLSDEDLNTDQSNKQFNGIIKEAALKVGAGARNPGTPGGGSSLLDASDAKLVFLLGNPRDSRIQTQVVEESRTYGDILQEDFVDSYMNLTIKSVMGLKWSSTHCPQARFLMKTDDDMFINISSLLTYLQEASASTWITGCIKQKKAFMPVNAHPGVSLPPGHPPFVAGAGYVISGDLVGALYAAS